MPELELTPEVAALKSGLGPFYGRLLAALERIADAAEAEYPTSKTRRKSDDA